METLAPDLTDTNKGFFRSPNFFPEIVSIFFISFLICFNNSELIDNRAKYFQYTLEMEYSPTYDFTIIGQITGSQLLEIGIADSIESAYDTYLFDPEDFFIPY